MTLPRVDKDAEVLLDLPGAEERLRGVVREVQGAQLVVECPGDWTCPAGGAVRIFFESAGTFWSLEALQTGEAHGGATPQLELELRGDPERVEQRGSLRVEVGAADLRASLGGEACEVLDLSEVAFSVRTRRQWSVGEVLEAVLYDQGEPLPGRVRVLSARQLDRGWSRYGLFCLDGRLKFGLAGVCLSVQRSQIVDARKGRTRSD